MKRATPKDGPCRDERRESLSRIPHRRNLPVAVPLDVALAGNHSFVPARLRPSLQTVFVNDDAAGEPVDARVFLHPELNVVHLVPPCIGIRDESRLTTTKGALSSLARRHGANQKPFRGVG